jgi:TATA-box binding protein (TBP) (component of TFIID and TFIIIB)
MYIITTNVVVSAKISGFDQNKILKNMFLAEFRPNDFPGICVPLGKNAQISLFDSGKITSKGASYVDWAIESIDIFIKQLRKLGMDIIIISKPVTSVIVFKILLDGKIDIAKIKTLPEFKKMIRGFNSAHLQFPNASLQVFADKITASSKTIDEIIPIAKMLEKYVTPKI